jgi:hypothetical protein
MEFLHSLPAKAEAEIVAVLRDHLHTRRNTDIRLSCRDQSVTKAAYRRAPYIF